MYGKAGKLLVSIVLAALAAGCASGPQFYTDYDPGVDFGSYRTFGFFEPMSIEGKNYSTLFGESFRTALRREMTARGYVESDNPELGINVSARMQEKTKVTTSSDPFMYGGYYHYRRGFYDPWMTYGYGTETHVSQYTEGTVNVDIVDMAGKRMVWEGVAIGRIKEGRSNAEIRQAIDSGVTTIFQDFPGQAGQ